MPALKSRDSVSIRDGSFETLEALPFNSYTDGAWVPVRVVVGTDNISLFYDDRVLMEVRRRNLKHPRAPSKDYPIRCSHIISNVRVVQEEETGCTVRSNFQCVGYYNNKQTLYAGRYTHELVRQDGALRIRSKRVDLINCDAVLNTIIIYI